jgi:hypothetical protein
MLAVCFTLVFCLFYSSTLEKKWHIPPKRQLTFGGLHGNISQKIGIFITRL